MRLRTPRDIGLVIRERRRALGLSQQELATRVGVSRQWIVEVEQGKRRAELGLVLRTLEAIDLGLRTDEAPPGDSTPINPAATVDLDALLAAHRRLPGAKP
jgi:HTH-type transcriptional regulator/antitoxin HipB